MTKSKLIENLRQNTGMSRAEATAAVETFLGDIQEALIKGEKVQLPGFGAFEVKEHTGHTGHNPATGEPIEIPPYKVVTFSAGKKLKEALATGNKKKSPKAKSPARKKGATVEIAPIKKEDKKDET